MAANEQEVVLKLLADTTEFMKKTEKMTQQVERQVEGMNKSMAAGFKGAIAILTGSVLKGFAKDIIDIAGNMEMLRAKMESVFGGGKSAEEAFGFITKVALEVPRSIDEVTRAAIALKAFGQDIKGTLKVSADLASLWGEDMAFAASSLGRALVSVGAADIFRERGLLKAILDFNGLKDAMHAATLTQKQWQKAVMDYLNSPAGIVFGMAAREAKTFQGQLSMVKDQWIMLVDEIGRAGLNQSINEIAQTFKNLLADREKFDQMKESIVSIAEAVKMAAEFAPYLLQAVAGVAKMGIDLGKGIGDKLASPTTDVYPEIQEKMKERLESVKKNIAETEAAIQRHSEKMAAYRAAAERGEDLNDPKFKPSGLNLTTQATQKTELDARLVELKKQQENLQKALNIASEKTTVLAKGRSIEESKITDEQRKQLEIKKAQEKAAREAAEETSRSNAAIIAITDTILKSKDKHQIGLLKEAVMAEAERKTREGLAKIAQGSLTIEQQELDVLTARKDALAGIEKLLNAETDKKKEADQKKRQANQEKRQADLAKEQADRAKEQADFEQYLLDNEEAILETKDENLKITIQQLKYQRALAELQQLFAKDTAGITNDEQRRVLALQKLNELFPKPSVRDPFAETNRIAKGMGKSVFDQMVEDIAGPEASTFLNDFGTRFGSTVGEAMINGVSSVESFLVDVGQNIGDTLGKQMGDSLGETLSKSLGPKAGEALGSFGGGMAGGAIGALAGQAIGGLFKLFSGDSSAQRKEEQRLEEEKKATAFFNEVVGRWDESITDISTALSEKKTSAIFQGAGGFGLENVILTIGRQLREFVDQTDLLFNTAGNQIDLVIQESDDVFLKISKYNANAAMVLGQMADDYAKGGEVSEALAEKYKSLIKRREEIETRFINELNQRIQALTQRGNDIFRNAFKSGLSPIQNIAILDKERENLEKDLAALATVTDPAKAAQTFQEINLKSERWLDVVEDILQGVGDDQNVVNSLASKWSGKWAEIQTIMGLGQIRAEEAVKKLSSPTGFAAMLDTVVTDIGKPLDQLKTDLLALIDRFIKQPMPSEEQQKAKIQAESDALIKAVFDVTISNKPLEDALMNAITGAASLTQEEQDALRTNLMGNLSDILKIYDPNKLKAELDEFRHATLVKKAMDIITAEGFKGDSKYPLTEELLSTARKQSNSLAMTPQELVEMAQSLAKIRATSLLKTNTGMGQIGDPNALLYYPDMFGTGKIPIPTTKPTFEVTVNGSIITENDLATKTAITITELQNDSAREAALHGTDISGTPTMTTQPNISIFQSAPADPVKIIKPGTEVTTT